MKQVSISDRLRSSRLTLLKTSVSALTLLGASGFVGAAHAQTNINNGDNTAVTSQADGETITAAAGVTSEVSGAPVVTVANNNVTVSNAGTLRSLGTSTQTIQFNADTINGILTNLATGRLESDSRVVNIDGDDVTINNSGTIIGTGDQRNGTVYANRTANNFTINNIGASSVIDAGEGNNGAGIALEIGGGGNTITGAISNEGTIRGRGQSTEGGTAGDGIRFFGPGLAPVYQFNGSITNSGTIASETTSSVVSGIRFNDRINFGGTITNEEGGVIYGTNNGLYLGEADHTGGVINNAGTIRSASRALNIDGTGIEINNTGSIVGAGNQRNGTVYADATAQGFTLNNSGSIDAGEGNEGAGFSVELSEEGNDFTITNSGDILGRGQASAGAATAGDGLRFERTRVAGALDGTTTGLFTGTITNSGNITSEATAGTTAGIRFVNGVSFQGTLRNEEGGVISGVNNGLYFGNATPAGGADHTGGVVYNAGTISSDSRALNIDGTGLEVNNLEGGQIIGTGNQRNGTVYADSTAQDFTFNNAGTVDAGEGNEGSGFGVEVSAEGSNFTLTNSGTIQGRGQASAAENGAGDGVRVGNVGNIGTVTGDITNSGAIRSEATAGTTAGIRFVNGIGFQGTLTNEEGGVIYGTNNGLYFGNPVDGEGADHTGGVVNNAGTITSASRALNIDGIGLTVNNLETGQIVGQGNQRNGTVYADSTAQDFTFNNAGTVDAGEGNEGSGFGVEVAATGSNFTLTNSGTIQGRGQASAAENGAGDGVRVGNVGNIGTVTGDITNSGAIRSEATAGTTAGIRFVNGIGFQGTLTNEEDGVIYGTNNGLYFGNPVNGEGADHTGGVVNNAGTITSASRALNIDGTGLVVNNTGRIVGQGNQRNGTVYADSTAQDFTLNNSGTIYAGEGNEGAGFSVELSEEGNSFTIENSGNIAGLGQAGAGDATAGDGLRFERTRVDGALEGSTTGLFTGTITNSGNITSQAEAGTTAGIRFVNGVSFQGTLNNEEGGVISGVNNGLYFGNAVPAGGADHTGGVVNNAGTISSDSRAVNIDGTGLVLNNTGSILGTGNQRNGTIYSDATANAFTINNSGTVDAGEGNNGAGVSIQVGGQANTSTIVNSGLIQGRGQAAAPDNTAGDGIRFAGPGVLPAYEFSGDITNSGQIRSEGTAGVVSGIRFSNAIGFTGTLTNEEGGVIYGTNNGLYFGEADHAGGVVNNAGTITSASRAVNIDGTGLVLNNSGNIVGQGNQRNGTVYLDGTADNITINNSGTIDAGEGNSGSGVSIEVLSGSRTHTIVNTGTIQGRGEALASGETAGIRAFYPPNMMRPDLNLTVENMGTIASETSAGILLENVTFTGSIANYGTISGATAAIDTRTSLGNVVIDQRAGSIDGDILTGAGDDVLNITGGALNGNIDLGAGSNQVNIASASGFDVDAARTIASNVSLDGSLNFTQAGSLAVTGDAAIASGTTVGLDFTDVTSLNFSQGQDLVTASGALTNGGATVADNSFLVDFALASTGSALTLTPTVANLSAVSGDANVNAFGTAFAAALNGGNGGAAFAANANAIDAFTSNAQFEGAAVSLLPSVNAGVTREIYETQNEVLSLIEDRVSPAAGDASGLWGQVFVRSGDQDSDNANTLSGYDATSYGFVLGLDTAVGASSRAGVAFSYADIDIDEEGGAFGSTDVENYAINAYYAYEQGGAFINGSIAYAFNNADALRTGILGDTISGEYDVDQFSARLNAGHTRNVGDFEVTPFASLQYATQSVDDFSELGGLNFDIDNSGVDFFEGGVGVKFASTIDNGSTIIRPEVSVGYFYDFVGDERQLSANFGGNSFNLVGADPSQSSFEVDAALNVYGQGNLSFAIGYDGEFRSGYTSHGGSARLRVKF